MRGGWDCNSNTICMFSKTTSSFPSFQNFRQCIVIDRAGVAWGGLSWSFARTIDKILITVKLARSLSLSPAETSPCFEMVLRKRTSELNTMKRTWLLDGGEKKPLFCNFCQSKMIIPPYSPPLLLIKLWTLNMWFAGRSLCLQHCFYLWGHFFSPPAALRRSVFKTACGNMQVNAHCFENPKEGLNPHAALCTQFSKVTLCTGLCQQLGLRWHSSLAVCGPLHEWDKQWEEESRSGDASVERRVSILSWWKDNFRLTLGDIAAPLFWSFLKDLSHSAHTHTLFRSVNLTVVLNCFRKVGGIVP